MQVTPFSFFQRDLSWLSFNERVLMEAGKKDVPLAERWQFLSIYSSNLDEFYRVRMPALAALEQLREKKKVPVPDGVGEGLLPNIKSMVDAQLNQFGNTLRALLPELEAADILFYYDRSFSAELQTALKQYFVTTVLAFMRPVLLEQPIDFFPENNQLYLVVTGTDQQHKEQYWLVPIPVDELGRFYQRKTSGLLELIFLEDIIRLGLPVMFPDIVITGCHSFKITRDASFELEDDYTEDLAEKMEKQIARRDYGLATRFLMEPRVPVRVTEALLSAFRLAPSVLVIGGRYHNLKDLGSIQWGNKELNYTPWAALTHPAPVGETLMNCINKQDYLIHTPYHSYDAVLRFFNEAAFDTEVEEISVTLYRVARQSRILQALLAAAHNGKKVTVLVELKARFDEANNIKWAKRLKKAGVQVVYSPANLKVHAKIALVKRKAGAKVEYTGLLATGNLNETTARFYTDHVLLTSHQPILNELQQLFGILVKGYKIDSKPVFNHLLVAQHKLLDRFTSFIDREILNAKQGLPAKICIKLNNLEERVLIQKLYEASNAGVQIDLIVRGICCLIPGVAGQSERIRVRRIVDRYLEHGRVYCFHNNGAEDIFLGSADWMNRNIYRRIEVCFPVYDSDLKKQLKELLELQLRDNDQAAETEGRFHSQEAIYSFLKNNSIVNQ